MAEFKNDILTTHNSYRRTHGSAAMKWSSKLQNNAQRWAEKLAKKGYLQHENQNEEGENIACMKGAELSGERATTMWYDEIKYYDYSKPTFNSKTGHFTQVVWNGSTELGVGRATASNGTQFVVARYNPPGNVLGKFQNNVLPRNGKPSIKPSSERNDIRQPTNNNRNAKPKNQTTGGRQSTYFNSSIDSSSEKPALLVSTDSRQEFACNNDSDRKTTNISKNLVWSSLQSNKMTKMTTTRTTQTTTETKLTATTVSFKENAKIERTQHRRLDLTPINVVIKMDKRTK